MTKESDNKVYPPLGVKDPILRELQDRLIVQMINETGLQPILDLADIMFTDPQKKYKAEQHIRRLVKRYNKENILIQ